MKTEMLYLKVRMTDDMTGGLPMENLFWKIRSIVHLFPLQ